MNELDELEKTLREGMRLSMQMSYARRAPAAKSLPYLSKAKAGLGRFLRQHPEDARAQRLLSLVEETLLHYGPAIAALERAMELEGKRDKRDLKRLAMLRETAKEWSKLPLTPAQLEQLGEFLEEKLADKPMERNLKWTEEWLRAHGVKDVAKVVAALGDRGAYSDAQVYYNVILG